MAYDVNTGAGTLPANTPAADSGGGTDIWGIIQKILGGAAGMVGGTDNAVKLALVTGLMQMLQKNMDKSVTSPKEAVQATENMRQHYTDQATNTAAPQKMIDDLRANLSYNVAHPVQPTVGAPKEKPVAFNPYASGGAGAGGASPDIMAKLKGIVSTPNPSQAWGQNLATNSLANRAGTRMMAQGGVSGQLIPQPLPAGSTSTEQRFLPVGTPAKREGGTLATTYGANEQNTPQQLQADYAIFKKGPQEPGYLSAFQRLTNYFSSGKLPAAPAVPGAAAAVDPNAAMRKVGLDPNYRTPMTQADWAKLDRAGYR